MKTNVPMLLEAEVLLELDAANRALEMLRRFCMTGLGVSSWASNVRP